MTLQMIYEKQLCTDLEIQILNKKHEIKHSLKVHKNIICSRSEYFNALLLGPLAEANKNSIDVVSDFPDVMKNILLSFYDIDIPVIKDPIEALAYIDCLSFLLLDAEHINCVMRSYIKVYEKNLDTDSLKIFLKMMQTLPNQ